MATAERPATVTAASMLTRGRWLTAASSRGRIGTSTVTSTAGAAIALGASDELGRPRIQAAEKRAAQCPFS